MNIENPTGALDVVLNLFSTGNLRFSNINNIFTITYFQIFKPSMYISCHISEYPDVCVSSPCNNEGVCHVTSDGGYNCTCPLGFTGDICDHGE